jgi:hypothetical protein
MNGSRPSNLRVEIAAALRAGCSQTKISGWQAFWP